MFTPITNAVVIRPDKIGTENGIILPGSGCIRKQGRIFGTVISVGPGRTRHKQFLPDCTRSDRTGEYVITNDGQIDPLEVKAGDRVLYETWESTTGGADRHYVDGEWVDILAEEFVLAVIEG